MTMELVLAVTALSSKRSLSGPSTGCPLIPLVRHRRFGHQTKIQAHSTLYTPRSGRSSGEASSAPHKHLQTHLTGSEIRAMAPQRAHQSHLPMTAWGVSLSRNYPVTGSWKARWRPNVPGAYSFSKCSLE